MTIPTSVDHALRRSIKKFKDVKPFTPHDLRRTAASHMTSLGVSRLIISKLLNHVENSVTAIYDRHTYDKEKRAAVDIWDAKLKNILNFENTAVNVNTNNTNINS